MEAAEPTKTQQGFLLVSHTAGWSRQSPLSTSVLHLHKAKAELGMLFPQGKISSHPQYSGESGAWAQGDGC